MKNIILSLILCNGLLLNAQRLEPVEISGTEFVAIPYFDTEKTGDSESGIKFINTATGEIKQAILPKDNHVARLEHVKIESLGIDKIVVIIQNEGKSVIVKGTRQSQLSVYSVNGTLEKNIILDAEVGRDLIVNNVTGRLVLISFKGSKFAPEHKQEEIIYDLRTNSIIPSK
ncbi:hypothetical protein [Flavobacterium silvaticum]|uniref:Uncharacterized protein n=1 Tax=Flavobacterium silvaticum TaxID=1852020 RepID=A0A972FK30_9FLAO|nr:hypothetical protein [Flavobacterium silvaticum]NMH27137.1 hypothetical protein [Flavobacterium silvaticum]